jgi:hypothetical protein
MSRCLPGTTTGEKGDRRLLECGSLLPLSAARRTSLLAARAVWGAPRSWRLGQAGRIKSRRKLPRSKGHQGGM